MRGEVAMADVPVRREAPEAAAARAAAGRNAYAELLRDTRGMRREQQQARDAWFAKLAADKKEESLFELEILLKGLACFANPRNHPGAGRRQTIVSLDFREHTGHVREGMTRVTQLARTMLGDRDRAFVFQRYLETVLPEDTARTRLLRASMAQESPDGSLFMLRHGFTNLIEVTNGLLRLSRVPFRLFYAMLATTMREITQSAFFNPLAALEFRPEFDRIPSPQVLELIQSIPGEQAHRLVALTFLSLFRILRYLRLIDSIAMDHSDRRVAGRGYLVLAVLRSDGRALSNYLRRRSGALLAESFEKELFRVPTTEIAARYDQMRAEGSRLFGIKGALTGLAANLRLEMRRAFEHDLPPPDAGTSEQELRLKLRQATAALRPAIQAAIHDSYMIFSPTDPLMFGDAAEMVIQSVSGAFVIGVQMSAPFIVFGLVFNLGMGILSRMMPQLQVFFIAMPATIGVGLVLIALLLSMMMGLYLTHFEGVLAVLRGA